MFQGTDRKSTAPVRTALALALALGAMMMDARAVEAQQAPDQTELQQLRLELQKIEARIDALEKAGAAPAPAATPAPAAASSSAPAPSPAPTEATAPAAPATGPDAVMKAEQAGMDTMDAGMGGEVINVPHLPQMKFRGFGDVRYTAANQQLGPILNTPGAPTPPGPGNNTFTLGPLDFFVTSQITDHFAFLTELVFQATVDTNNIGVDTERSQLSWTPSEKFSVNIGRSHAMMGYYNTAFHHGTWFQTTVERPRIFNFEDSGGPLPVHNVGLEFMGKLPGTNKLGIHWFGEVGNGKLTYDLALGPNPANVLADHNGKSTNIGLLLRPERFTGLQFGFSWYQAAEVPVVSLLPGFGTPNFAFPQLNAIGNAGGIAHYHENIYVAHVVYITPKFEFLAEAAEAGNTLRGASKATYLSGGYVQVARTFKEYRPYARFEWLNPNFRDPNLAWTGHWVGPLGGVRWDPNTFVGVKFEYEHSDFRNFTDDLTNVQLLPLVHKTLNQVTSQITFTF